VLGEFALNNRAYANQCLPQWYTLPPGGVEMGDGPSRVFISCGQRDEELKIADQIKEMLKGEGFDPWVAARVHRGKALRENIFGRLRDTGYFLLVDFRREAICPEISPIAGEPCLSSKPEHRGSLFTHQELAIASYLDLNILAFQEDGVRRLDGLLGHLQVNAIPFSNRADLVSIVRRSIEKEAWHNNWRNQLILAEVDDSGVRVPQMSGRNAIFFHLQVTNRHERAAAQNCYAYLRSVSDAATNEPVPFEPVELKWRGYTFPNVSIRPGACRMFDAIWFDPADPLRPRFSAHTDWMGCIPDLQGPGSWELEFEVVSDNVPGAKGNFRLEIDSHRNVQFGNRRSQILIADVAPLWP
jgi:hypothetical protein